MTEERLDVSNALDITGKTYASLRVTGFDCGGAICICPIGSLEGSCATFKSNSSEYDAGAIFNDGGKITLDNAAFTDNFAVKNGGAIYNRTSGTIQLNTVSFSGNTVGSEVLGGSIYNISGEVILNGVTLEKDSDTIYIIPRPSPSQTF